MRSSHLFPGVPLALASAVLFGAVAPLGKVLLGSVDPVMLAGLMYLGTGLGLAAYRLVTGRTKNEAPVSRADVPWLASAIVAGGIVGPVLLMLGLSRTSAANGSLLLNLENLATMAIAWLVFRENVDRRLLIGAAAILAGAILLSWQGEVARIDPGALMIAGACLAWGIDNNLTRKVSASDPAEITMWKGLVAGSCNIAIAFAIGAQWPALMPMLASGALGLFGIGLSLMLFIRALRYLGTARTGAYYSIAPFVGAVSAVVFLEEPLTMILLAAIVLMAVGLYLHLSERHVHEHTHEALAHDHAHVHDEHHQHGHGGTVSEPHSHPHVHTPQRHAHVHYPDIHHQHGHRH